MRRHIVRFLKVSAALAVISSLGVWWLARSAMAELSERSLAVAPELAQWAELMGRTTDLEVNGQRLTLSTMTTELPPDVVLARFDALCAKASPELTADLLAKQPHDAPYADEPFLGVLKEAHPAGGGVRACIAQSAPGGMRGLTARLEDFLEQRDLGVFGQFRYLVARQMENGGTHALMVFNRGSLKLDQMLPSVGDAAGGDLDGVPRPDDSTRLLSAQALGRPYGVVAYVVKGTPEQALEGYLETLSEAGIKALRVLPEEAKGVQLRGAMQGDQPLVVHAFFHGAETLVSVVKLGGQLTTQVARTR